MLKPNPLSTILSTVWYAFKCFTAAVGQIGGLCMLVTSLVLLGTAAGVVCLIVGGLIFYLGKDLTKTLQAEETKSGDDDDESPDLPLGTV